jgi:DNA-3-methyladenine glycosylase II
MRYNLGMARSYRGKAAALRHFKKVDPHFHKATEHHHASLSPELGSKRTRAQLFSSLVSIVISQQLGTGAADTIFRRVKEACGGHITPDSVRSVNPAKLRKAGLSGAKTKTIKEIAKAVHANSLDLAALKTMPESRAAEMLMSIWGLGPWSVEMFMMFCLGREDVFSAGDLGLIRAIESLYDLPKNAPKTEVLKIAQTWSPYRTYASLLLWRTRDVPGQVFTRAKGRHR